VSSSSTASMPHSRSARTRHQLEVSIAHKQLEGGGTVEVGIIGHEGMVGINIFLGCLVTPDKAIVQISGSAMRMKTSDLRKELRFGSPLQRLLLRYTQALLAIISQSVACSQHHTVGQRLARWLLTMHDHAESNEFEMPHISIAAMLGARREGVTEAAGKLQAAGLITYRRARIQILNEAGLKKKSCECLSVYKTAVRRPAEGGAWILVRRDSKFRRQGSIAEMSAVHRHRTPNSPSATRNPSRRCRSIPSRPCTTPSVTGVVVRAR
jgi:Crp-like helix-turn-helix domain